MTDRDPRLQAIREHLKDQNALPGYGLTSHTLLHDALDLLTQQASTLAKLQQVEVTQPNGQPLPAPCAISGCHYAQLHEELEVQKNLVATADESISDWIDGYSAISEQLDGDGLEDGRFSQAQRVAKLRLDLAEADASHARLIAALQWIRDNDPDCQCEHDDEDCCAEQSSGFCARCLAAKYLATEPTR